MEKQDDGCSVCNGCLKGQPFFLSKLKYYKTEKLYTCDTFGCGDLTASIKGNVPPQVEFQTRQYLKPGSMNLGLSLTAFFASI